VELSRKIILKELQEKYWEFTFRGFLDFYKVSL
jgi:hypothetical protein